MKKIAEYQISLKVFLKNEKGETLILNTLTPTSFYGAHDFPGGRIDTDEYDVDLKDILMREIYEEIGDIQVELSDKPVAISRNFSPKELSYTGTDNYIFYTFWEGKIISGDVNISDEHHDHLWVDLNDIVLEDYFSSGMLEAAKMYLNKK